MKPIEELLEAFIEEVLKDPKELIVTRELPSAKILIEREERLLTFLKDMVVWGYDGGHAYQEAARELLEDLGVQYEL